jgi:DNA-binding transcriptional LysR family regulator
MRRLPPLNSLRVFEVAARTGSYAAAGAELGLTHGAVSRHIAGLEAWLGQRLFVRAGRRMGSDQHGRRIMRPPGRAPHSASQRTDHFRHALADPPA